MRHLAAFFAIGALLLAARHRIEPWLFPPALTVHVAASAGEDEIERAIDEAILLEQALARGGALLDPVVREQLLQAMQDPSAPIASDAPGEPGTLEGALALGVHRADPVVRRRLAFQSEQLLMARAEAEQPTDDVLAEYARAHAERYARVARFSLQQVFVSRDLHGEALDRAAAAQRPQLPAGEADPRQLARLSDPTLLPSTLTDIDARALDARFGPGFATAVAEAPVGTWSGPVRSAYGLHFLRVTARVPGQLPALARIRARVLAEYRLERRSEVLRAQLRALRAAYRIDVRRQPS